jgi:ureidoglycolate lyase
MMRSLTIEPLTKEAFEPFGQVIETEGSDHFPINNGSTQRFHQLATVELNRQEDQAIISIFKADTLSYPLEIKMLERHPQGSQAFIPMERQRFLIVVAPPADQPNPNDIRAFISNGRQGLNYGKGVWHHPILALENGSDFLIVDRKGEGNNCDEHFFADGEITLLDADINHLNA